MAEHEKVHVICENLCLEEGMTKEQIINELNGKASKQVVDSLASGSPLVASSVSGMTDTSRVYVNTSNGHWYWYNGSSWQDGGVYQAAEDSETVNELNIKVNTLDKNLKVLRNVANPSKIVRNTVYFNSSNYSQIDGWSTLLVKVKPNTLYTVWNLNNDYCWYSNENGANLGSIGIVEGLIKTPLTCTELKLSNDTLTDNFYVVEGNDLNSPLYKTNLEHLEIVNSIISKLEPIKETIHSQFVDSEKSEENKYWQFSSKSSADTFLAYDPIVLSPGTYTLYNAMGEFTYWNDGEWNKLSALTGNQQNNERTVLTFTNTTTIYITRNPIEYDTMLIDGDVNVSEYKPFGYFTTLSNAQQSQNSSKTFYVGANEEFTKIKDAVAEAIQYKNSKVYIQDGTYDLISEFGSNYLENTTSDRGIELKNGIHLIFSPNAKVTCNYTGNNDFIKTEFAAFNSFTEYSSQGVKRTGFTLEGINIEASNIRYVIHDEHSGSDVPYTNIYKNCNMKFDNRNNDKSQNTQCIGGGLGLSGEIIIENCIFDSERVNTSMNTVYAVSYHNSSAQGTEGVSGYHSNVIVKDNYFKGQYNTFRAGYVGILTDVTTCLVSNNNMGANPICVDEQSGSPYVNMELIEWNNHIRNS